MSIDRNYVRALHLLSRKLERNLFDKARLCVRVSEEVASVEDDLSHHTRGTKVLVCSSLGRETVTVSLHLFRSFVLIT